MPEPVSDELRLVQQMARSRYWRYQRSYLIARREEVIATPATSTEQLHQKEGAIQELTRLLRAPELVAIYLQKQAQAESAEAAVEPPAPDWLGLRAGSDMVE